MLVTLWHVATSLQSKFRPSTRTITPAWMRLNEQSSSPSSLPSPQSSRIAGLLERAATMASGMLRMRRKSDASSSSSDTGVGGSADSVLQSPLNLNFKAKAKTVIVMEDAAKAREYLALPASEYNLLNSTFVERAADDVFTLILPLDAFGDQIGIGTPISLRTNITVTPTPDCGKITMGSGPIVITPSNPKHDALEVHIIASNSSTSGSGGGNDDDDDDGGGDGKNENGEVEEDMVSSLPVWLIYGASATQAGTTITGATKLQSSLQTGVSIELQWPVCKTSDQSRHADADSETLAVTAKVGVDVSLSLPLPHDVSSVLNFYPIRAVLNQAGGLIAKTVLSTLAPELSKALVADYQSRMISCTVEGGADPPVESMIVDPNSDDIRP